MNRDNFKNLKNSSYEEDLNPNENSNSIFPDINQNSSEKKTNFLQNIDVLSKFIDQNDQNYQKEQTSQIPLIDEDAEEYSDEQSKTKENNIIQQAADEQKFQKNKNKTAAEYHHLINKESATFKKQLNETSVNDKEGQKMLYSNQLNEASIIEQQQQQQVQTKNSVSKIGITPSIEVIPPLDEINDEDEFSILGSSSSDDDEKDKKYDMQMGMKQVFKKNKDFTELQKSKKEFKSFQQEQKVLFSNSKLFQMKQELINKSLEEFHNGQSENQDDQNQIIDQEEANENYEERSNINFQDMIDSKNIQTQRSFPFTRQHVEDCLFLTSQEKIEGDNNYKIKTEILSLECIFYQSGSVYQELEVDPCPKNSMCTENYKLADYDNRIESLAFNQEPINMKASRGKSFLKFKKGQVNKNQNQKSSQKIIELVQTENKEAKVQYFLTLWSLNQAGGITRKFESDGFKMGRYFQDHYNLSMELKMSDDGQLIFVTQGLNDPDRDFEIKVWSKEKLQLLEMGNSFQKIVLQIRQDEKQKYKVKNQNDQIEIVSEIRISSQKGFLCLFYRLECPNEDKRQDLERIVFYDIERGEQVFVFNCQLQDLNSETDVDNHQNYDDMRMKINSTPDRLLNKQNVSPSNLQVVNQKQIEIQTRPKNSTPIFSNFQVFPLKIMLNTRKQLHLNKLENDLNIKVVYACDMPYSYQDADGQDRMGCYLTTIDFSLRDLIKDILDKLDMQKNFQAKQSQVTDIQKQEYYNQVIIEMGKIAAMKFQQFDQNQNQKSSSDLKKSFHKEFFILNQDWFEWHEKDILIRYLDIQATRDFLKIAINCNTNLRRQFLVFDTTFQEENQTYNPMSRLIMGIEEKQLLQAKFVRNQYFKNEIFCIQQSRTEKKCILFCQKDPIAVKKHFSFDNDHQFANQDVILIENKNDKSFLEFEIFSVTIKQFDQEFSIQNLKPIAGQSRLMLHYKKNSQTQVFQNQHPTFISNLGMHRLCLHINLNQQYPAAFIHNLRNNGRDEDEEFFGFVDFKNFKAINLDIRNINIDACQKFMYLTKSPQDAIKNGKEAYKVYLNFLIIDSLNKRIQVVNFQSSKVFYFSKEAIFQDIVLKNIPYLKDDEFRMITQFQKSLHFAILEPDIIQKIGSADIQNDASQLLQKFRNQFKGLKVEVYMFQDIKQSIIYYADYADQSETSQNYDELILIKQYNPFEESLDKRLVTLLSIKTEYLILFKQLEDNLFVIIDSKAKITLYKKENDVFENVGKLYMHPKDQIILQSINGEYLDAVITKNLLVIGNHIFYLFENKKQIYDGILERQDLLLEMKSDISFIKIHGPISDSNQNNFIFIFGYRDSSNDFHIFKQLVYEIPDSYQYNLVNHSEDLCNFSTFQPTKSGFILAQIGKKYLYFYKKGFFMDEVQFLDQNWIKEKISTEKFKQRNYINENLMIEEKPINLQQNMKKDQIDYQNLLQKGCFIVYWFEFICEIDSGVNKLIFKNYNDAEDYYNHMIFKNFTAILIGVNHSDGQLQKMPSIKKNNQKQRIKKSLTQESPEQNKETAKSNHNGFEILEYADEQVGLEQKACFRQAREDYIQRYNMIQMSDDGLSFLFYDKIKEQYGLWEITDQREQIFQNLTYSQKKAWEKHLELVDQGKKQDNKDNIENDIQQNMLKSIKTLFDQTDSLYYPEDKYPFTNYKSTKKFISSHLRTINLEKKRVQIVTHSLPQGTWKMYPPENLLSDKMTKFYSLGSSSETKEQFVELTFNQAVQISAIGFQSANNYKHLDPESVEIITWDSDGTFMCSEFFVHTNKNQCPQLTKCIPLKFNHRLQTLVFLKKNPWQNIKKIKIIIKPNEQQDISMRDQFQLAQILVYKKRKHFDYLFIKKADLEFYDSEKQEIKQECKQFFNNQMLDELVKSFDPDREKGFDSKDYKEKQNEEDQQINKIPFYYLKKLYSAFINQKNVEKHIIRNEHGTQVVFAYCDQYGYNYTKNQNNQNNPALPYIGFKGLIFDVKQPIDNNSIDEKNVVQLKIFEKQIEKINQENQQREIRSLADQINQLEISIQKDFIIHCGKENIMKDNELQHNQTVKLRELQFKFNEIIKIKFGSVYIIINQGNQISYIPIKDMIGNCNIENFDYINQQKIITNLNMLNQIFSIPIQKNTNDLLNVKVLSQNFTSSMEILEIHFTSNSNKIIIIVFDTEKQILIVTTWNLEQDQEDSMLQFQVKVSDPKQIQYQILQGVHGWNDFFRPVNHIVGSMNFILFDNMIIDLESNIPYIYSPLNITTRLDGKKGENQKKLFKDSTRFLGINNPQQIIFTNNYMDLLFMRDISQHQDRTDILSQNQNMLQLFKKKFKETSLFHQFADDSDMITLFHKQFIQAYNQGNLQDYQNRMLPLLTLDYDVKSKLTALQKSLICQKPGNFELMIDMITTFQEICRSKIMLENVQQMVKQGFKEALQFFDQSQFCPPLFQTPYVVEWPEDKEYFIFTSKTSIVSEEMLRNRLNEKNSLQKLAEFFSKIFNCQCFENKQNDSQTLKTNKIKNLDLGENQQNYIFQINEENNIDSQKSSNQYNLTINEDEHFKQSWKRVNVSALNYDWIFSGNNLENFLMLLHYESNIAIFKQTNIKVLIDLLWNHYYWSILIYEFIPYIFYLIVFNVLTSNWGYLQKLGNQKVTDVNLNSTLSDSISNASENSGLQEIIDAQLKNMQDIADSKQSQTALIVLTLIYIIKFVFVETIRFFRIGMQKYMDMWSFLAITSVTLNLTYIIILLQRTQGDIIDPSWKETLNTLGAFASFLMWINMFYWMKIFKKPAYFVAQLQATIDAVGGFIVVSHLVIFGFGNFFLIVDFNISIANQNKENPNDPDLSHYNNDNLGIPALNAIINMYMVALGQFNTGPYSAGPDVYEVWFMILFASLVIIIMFMNMLIAVMSQPFADVQDNEETYRNMQIVEMIVSHLDLVNLKDVFKNQKYIIVLKPESNEVEYEDRVITELKEFQTKQISNNKSIKDIQKKLKNFIDTQMQEYNSQKTEVNY